MIDLSGAPAPWSVGELAHWDACLRAASSSAGSWGTPDPRGDPGLREVLGSLLGADVDRLMITSGVRSTFRSLAWGCRTLYTEEPTFRDIPGMARALGLSVRSSALVLAADRSDPRGILWLTSPARNPDGHTIPDEVGGRLPVCADRLRRCVVNETYRWSDPQPRLAGCSYVGTLGKVLGGGAKVGWLVTAESMKGRSLPTEGGPPGPWQRALSRFAGTGGLQRRIERVFGSADALCQRFVDRVRISGIPVAGLETRRSGHHVLLRMPGPRESAAEPLDVFRAQRVLAAPGAAFLGPPRSVRISFVGVPAENEEEALSRTMAALQNWHRKVGADGY